MLGDDALPIWQDSIEKQIRYIEQTLSVVQALYNRKDIEDCLKCLPRIKSELQRQKIELAKLRIEDCA